MGGVKDLFVAVAVLGVLLAGLYAFTGVWPPAVIVESGSMMHRDGDVAFGRFGTIDPGDMVLVKSVTNPTGLETWADGGKEHYGAAGEVVVYRANGVVGTTPIIHRAMAWVDVDPASEDARYRVRWSEDKPCPDSATRSADGGACLWSAQGITADVFGVIDYRPTRPGYITKGDNPFSNPSADQVTPLSEIVQPEWIVGTARGEIPWIGLIKLALAPTLNQDDAPDTWMQIGNARAPRDLWTMLLVSSVAVLALPPLVDAAFARWRDRRRPDS